MSTDKNKSIDKTINKSSIKNKSDNSRLKNDTSNKSSEKSNDKKHSSIKNKSIKRYNESPHSRGKRHSIPDIPIINSDDIGVSELDLLANKRKINKLNTERSVSKEHSNSVSKSIKKYNSSDSDVKNKEKDRFRKIQKENNNESIRYEKNEFLCKITKLDPTQKWSHIRLDMNNSFDEIRNEFERIAYAIKVDSNVKFYKQLLLLGVQGVETLNTNLDPFGIDLQGWSEAMAYSMDSKDSKDYDMVIEELYEKYKTIGEFSPEVKLLSLILQSATMFVISKKLSNIKTNDIMGFIGKFMNNSTPPPPPTPGIHSHNFIPNNMHIPSNINMNFSKHPANYTDTVEDNTPSKIPNPDTIEIKHILETMKKNKESRTTSKKPESLRSRNLSESKQSLDKTNDEGTTESKKTIKSRKGRPKVARRY